MSTSGGAGRYGSHTWDCQSVTHPQQSSTPQGARQRSPRTSYFSESNRPNELNMYIDSIAVRGLCQHVDVGSARHYDLKNVPTGQGCDGEHDGGHLVDVQRMARPS